ncbi:MAG: histidine kinase [Bacteroidota bacterium]|nr:histidine kinase [Bacteroidota bacterium]
MFKVKPQTYLLLFFLCITSFIYSQDIADLKNELAGKNEKDKIETYLKIANLFSDKYAKSDSTLYYANIAYKLSEKNNYTKGQQKALLNIAIAFQGKNNYDTSTLILKQVLVNAETVNDFELIGEVKLNLGLNYRRTNNMKAATASYLDAISAFEKVKNYTGLCLANSRLAGIFTLEKQSDVALLYGRKAKALLAKVNHPFSKLTILSGLSGMYIQLAAENKIFTDSSIVCAKMALDLVDQYKYYTKGNQICISISNAYTYKGDYNEALKYVKLSMNYKEFLFPSEIIMSYMNFSDCYFLLKQYNQSLLYLDSVRFVLRYAYDPYYDMLMCERIYAYNKEIGNFEKALEGKERHSFLTDSLFTIEKAAAINELEQKYNRSENDKKINDLNKENEITALNVKFLIVGILATILAIIIIVFFYRQSLLKNKFTSLETQQRLNRARMDPHFVFNALSSIQTLSMDKENSGRVSQLISQFSKIMRQSLESTYDELTTIEEEIDFLNNYLNIQKMRFPNKFDHEIKVDESIEQNELKVPGMLLQPFIENSVEHGFKNIDHRGKIEIVFLKENDQLKITISDNGEGFGTNSSTKQYPSRATQIITDRLFILNKQHRSKASFEIKDNKGKGVMVLISLPLIYD